MLESLSRTFGGIPPWLIVGGVVVIVGAVVLWPRISGALGLGGSAGGGSGTPIDPTAGGQIDPYTGVPYTIESQINPATGLPAYYGTGSGGVESGTGSTGSSTGSGSGGTSTAGTSTSAPTSDAAAPVQQGQNGGNGKGHAVTTPYASYPGQALPSGAHQQQPGHNYSYPAPPAGNTTPQRTQAQVLATLGRGARL